MKLLVMILLMPLLLIFLECLEKTILFMPRFLKLDLSVMVKLMEVTMLTLRLNAKHFIFAQLMELEVWPSTASSVLMVHSSTRTISYVTGGSILTAPLLRISTQLGMMLVLIPIQRKAEEVEDWEVGGITGEGAEEGSEV